MKHDYLVRYLLIIFIISGFTSFFYLGQDEDPPFTFRAMVISAEWPGATALEVAKQVTEPLETKLKTISARSKIISFSREGKATIIFQIRGDIPAEETEMIWTNVRNKIKDIHKYLPYGVMQISFNDDFGDTFGIIYALSGESYSPKLLDRFVRKIREDFLSLKDVGKVEIFGQQREKIYIEVSRRALNKYNITTEILSQQLKENNSVLFSGNIEDSKYITSLRVDSQYRSVDEIKNTRINTKNEVIKLGEVAKVFRSIPDPFNQKVKLDGNDVIAIGISMKKGGDIINLGKNVDKEVRKIKTYLPIGINLEKIQDQPNAVSETVNEFLIVFFEAVLIVLVVSLLSLGIKRSPISFDFKPGLIVAISIPLVMAITFLIMKMFGIGLHKVSLGALIISLGLLVDDAIIVVEMMFRKIEQGFGPFEAVSASYELTAKPMLTGTLITAIGFLPIGLARSEVGEYTFAIYAVTATALLVSWFVAVFFIPVFGYWLLNYVSKKQSKEVKKNSKDDYSEKIQIFRKSLKLFLSYKFFSLFLIFIICVFGFFGLKKVEKQFFPESNRPEILVDIYLPERTSSRETEKAVAKIEREVKKIANVESIVSWLGSGAPRFFLPLDIIFPNSNVAQLVITPTSRQYREKILSEIRVVINKLLPEARVRLKVLPNGPPVPYPVSFRLLSDNEKDIYAVADKIQRILTKNHNLVGVHNNWGKNSPVVKVQVDKVRARELGVTPLAISNALKVRSFGTKVGEFRDEKLLLPIELRLRKDERDQISDLRGIIVTSISGETVPIEKIVKFSVAWEPPIIWRYDNKYAMSIQGDTVGKQQSSAITKELLEEINRVKSNFPVGVDLQIGGTVEESNKGQTSIFAGLPIMFFLIFTLLVIQLSGISRSLLVAVTAPLGVSGAITALILFDRPLGFVAGLGVVALIGMIIRNSLILVDQIERERTKGLNTDDSILNATIGRFRPIMLTAGTAVLAMIPLTNSIFWGPMAVAIMGGLIIGTILTLLLVPILYSIFFNTN